MSWPTVSDSGEGAPSVGNVHNKLRCEAEHFKIAHRRTVLDLEALSWHGAVSLIF